MSSSMIVEQLKLIWINCITPFIVSFFKDYIKNVYKKIVSTLWDNEKAGKVNLAY